MSNRPQWWWPPVCGGKEQGQHNPLSKPPCPRFLSHIMAQVREFPQFLCDSALLWRGRGRLDKFTSSPFLTLPWHLPSNRYCWPWKQICRRSSTQACTNLHPSSLTRTELVSVVLSLILVTYWIWCLWYIQSLTSENSLRVSLTISLLDRNKMQGQFQTVSPNSQLCSFASLSHFWKHHIWALVVHTLNQRVILSTMFSVSTSLLIYWITTSFCFYLQSTPRVFLLLSTFTGTSLVEAIAFLSLVYSDSLLAGLSASTLHLPPHLFSTQKLQWIILWSLSLW